MLLLSAVSDSELAVVKCVRQQSAADAEGLLIQMSPESGIELLNELQKVCDIVCVLLESHLWVDSRCYS
jgi:hypothetical protein